LVASAGATGDAAVVLSVSPAADAAAADCAGPSAAQAAGCRS
jgi:hypothetical protein